MKLSIIFRDFLIVTTYFVKIGKQKHWDEEVSFLINNYLSEKAYFKLHPTIKNKNFQENRWLVTQSWTFMHLLKAVRDELGT